MERWALFTDKEEADKFAGQIEELCKAIPGKLIRKKAVWIEWLSKYVVQMEVEPTDLTGLEIVSTVEPPVVEMEEL